MSGFGEADIRSRMGPYLAEMAALQSDESVEMADTAKKLLSMHDLFTIPILEELLSVAKARVNKILADDIPCLLSEYGMSSCKMLDGTDVGIDTFYETSQKDKDPEMLASWLEQHGYAQIIKDTLALDKGAFDKRLEEFLNMSGYSYSRSSSINGQTLKKTIKEHLMSGGQMPPVEAVDVKQYNRAVVKMPKVAKGF